MNSKSEECSTDNNNTDSIDSSQQNKPNLDSEGTPTSSSSSLSPGETSSLANIDQTGGCPSNGANSNWSYAQSGQYQQQQTQQQDQQQYYPQYQYSQQQQQQQPYNEQNYYQESACKNLYYQDQQYFNQNSYQYSEQQQQQEGGKQVHPDQNQQEQQQGQQLQQQEEQENQEEQTAHDQTGETQAPRQQNPRVDQNTLRETGKCWECGAAFQDDELLRDHLVLFHAEIPAHKCHSCPAVFPSQSTLTLHITTSHLVGASIQSASQVQRPGNLTQEEDEDEFDEEEEEEEDDDEEEEDSDQEDYLKGIVSSGASISVSGSGGSSLSSLLAKGISVSGGDSSVASSLQAKGISVSGGDSSVKSSLQAKGVLVSGSSSSLAETLPTKSISVSGGSDSPLSSLLAKGISVSGGDSPLKALQGKGISISGGNSSVTSLQSKGISISGGDSSLSFLQAKGISISSAESQQTKGASVSDQDSSLSYLQAKGISISGAESSLQAKGVSVSGGSDSLSFLQAKGISVSGAESSLESKGTSVSGGDSSLSSLLAKGISVSGGDSSLQGKSAPQSSAEDQLSSLQSKGITLAPAKSQLSSLQTKGISVSAASNPLSLLQGKGVSLSAANPQLSSLQAKGISFSTPSNQIPSLEGKGVSLSAPNSQLNSLQAKGISLSSANSQLASFQDNEASPSASEASPSANEASPLGNEASPSARETSPSAPDSQLSSLHAKGVSLSAATSQVASHQAKGPSQRPAKPLVKYRQAKGTVAFQKTKETTAPVSKPKESPLRRKEYFGCVYCRIKQFKSVGEFEKHHQNHVKQTKLKVILLQVNPEDYRRNAVDTRRKKRSAGLKLKLKISKVGRGRGRKRREVRIVSNEGGMSESHKSSEEREGLEAEHQEEGEEEATASNNLAGEEEQSEGELGEESSRHSADLNNESTENQEEYPSSGHDIPNDQQQDYQQEEQGSEQGNFEQQKDQEEEEVSAPPQTEEAQGAYQTRSAADQGSNSNSGFDTNFSEQDLGFGAAGPSEAPPSTYQPQFESFPTSDWFSEYESGSRIAAAMAGATTAETASEGGWAGGSDASTNPAYTTANTGGEKDGQGTPVNGGENQVGGEDGLFSQAVLGQESPDKNDRQGSFEQLCLNDAYSGQAQNGRDGQSDQVQGVLSEEQQEHQQQSGVASDLLSELEYLNNSGQPPPGSQPGQIEGSPHSGGPSPHSGGAGTPSHLSSRGSNSGTPTSSGGHPTPPPSDTSFRALATSPMTSPTQPTSPLLPGQTPPATSPLQQSSDQQPGVPRLTIANNLMAPTTSSQITPTTNNNQAGVGGMMSRYGSQWPQAPGYTGTSGYGSLGGTSMANSNMAGTLRAPLPPSVGMPYRPSPPARVRGRPPLMGQIGRPPLHQGSLLQPSRGPGRPPTSSILPPPLMPAPGGRGSMMPPLQRMHQGMYQGQRQSGPQQQNGASKRPLLGAAGHSPSKNARREDINVPSRQKDNECQIIAVANRSDGLPVIANVQGGSGSNQRAGSTPPTTSESTINLSDSITLSVRSNAGDRPPQRGERGGGDAGTVANLLASRGITVTPAAGERQDGAGGGRDDRRLPTAQELNLSSAISVHPPTQREREASAAGRERDRDGFAVPQAPVRSSSSSSSSNNVERPPRPPTVDLTQDIPVAGSQGTRHPCSQCDRTFPTASLLADHSRVHQQSQQTRMPFKCHLCTAGFSTQKGQQHHYQQFHQLHLSAGDIAIPLVDLRNPVNVQRMAALGIRSFLPLTNLQNRGAGGVVGIPVLTLENLRNGHMTLQQWGVSDVLSLGPAKTLSMPR